MPVVSIKDKAQLQNAFAEAGAKLVVIDFTASWCGPCRTIAPVYEALSNTYHQVVFLKIDVDECSDIAESYGVTAMPTFIFLRNKVKTAQLTGGDKKALENKLAELCGGSSSSISEESSGVPGHIDLVALLNKPECECLNEADDHPYTHCLTSGGGFLESDCDEQLILSLTFLQSVKIHSLKIKAPEENGPKCVRLFINQPRTLDFDQASGMEAIQELQLEAKTLSEGVVVPLRYVKFQNVLNLQIFIKDNQNEGETTQVDYLSVIGSPVCTTKMGDFKRVAGKKGESH